MKVRAFLTSMAGRIFLVLLVGVAISATLATGLADARRRAELERAHLEMAADRIHDFVAALGDGRPAILAPGGLLNIEVAPSDQKQEGAPDPELTRFLTERLGARADAHAVRAPLPVCAGIAAPPSTKPPHMTARRCWVVNYQTGGGPISLLVDWPPRPASKPRALDPAFQIVLLIAAAILSFFVARMAAAPLKDLARAASDLGRNLDRAPLPETGPTDVAAAARAFNAMQAQLRRDLAERRHMLAAITHDLQTPLTRLRLRLEKVKDEELRERLVADIAAMKQLIQEGLDLARSAEQGEPAVVVDLESLVVSLVEDESDAGRPVVFTGGATQDVRVRPAALRRALANLIDNAVRHGGGAEVAVDARGGTVIIHVRDSGPGIPADQLDAVLEPFVRLEDSRSRETGGAGLGLAIARTLLGQNGAALALANRPEGGLDAVVTLKGA